MEWYRNFKKNDKNDLLVAEAGFCPNCWGQQEYDGKFVKAVEDQQISINNKDPKAQRAFVMDFVKTHLEPIRLKRPIKIHFCKIFLREKPQLPLMSKSPKTQ